MDRYEGLAIKLSLGLIGLFFMAVMGIAVLKGIDVPTCTTDYPPFKEGKLIKISDKEYELHVVARMWTFEPSRVEIPAGSKVTVFVTSLDVQHGFEIEGKAVNLMAIPGAVNRTEVVFKKPGTYRVVCNEFCGIAHQNMYATIVVR